MKNKLIVILGPTASGKSELAVHLAKKFNGEIISADSRQVYRGMDIGTGKVPRDKSKIKNQKSKIQIKNKKDYFHQGVKHHLLDVALPKRRFSVAQYQKLAFKAIKKIQQKGKIPILCGGTGFYIQSVIEGLMLPKVKPDWKLRKKLEKKSIEELFKLLKKLDPKRAKNIDRYNPRRLIRAIEIVKKTKKPVPPLHHYRHPFSIVILGIKKSPAELKKLIAKRLKKRFKQGMINEVKKLKKSGLSWKRLEEFGLEYRWIARYLRPDLLRRSGLKKLNYQEMINHLQKDIEHFSKRQMTWFKRDSRIHWIHPHTKSGYENIVKLCKKFLQ